MKTLRNVLQSISLVVALLAVQSVQAGIVWFPQPSDINVDVRLKEDGTYWFIVDLNSNEISSFHVQTDLRGEQHYSARDPGWGTGFLGDPPYTITGGKPDWRFSAEGGTFFWQTDQNVKRKGDNYAWLFRVRNENFTESTQFKFTFDKIIAPLPATSWMIGSGLLVLFAVEALRRRKNAKRLAASHAGF